jgi:YD repeat-containing protein
LIQAWYRRLLDWSGLRIITNSQGASTNFGYDPNGNLLSFKDSKNNETVYTVDNMDRVKTRKDPLLQQDVYEYEPGGSLKRLTDRRGLVTGFWYDILGRKTLTGFKETLPLPAPLPIPHNYESTITSTYDKGDRLISAVDSLTGTITLDYDPLGRLKTKPPPGAVSPTRTTTTGAGAP